MDESERTYSLPDLCGPGELANLLVWFRSHEQAKSILSPITDEGIRRFIDLAFYLSLSPEEGRYPRLRMVNQKESNFYLAIRFDDPVKLSVVDDLRRLAPACMTTDFALLVVERDTNLYCVGLTNIGPLGLNSQPGRPEDIGVGGPSFRVSIESPGHLWVQDGFNIVELREGSIRRATAFWYVPAIKKFLAGLGEQLSECVIGMKFDDKSALNYFGGIRTIGSTVLSVMERLLLSCLRLGHGGAFVVLPSDDSVPNDFDINCKYGASNLDLGRDIVNFWVQCICTTGSRNKSIFERELVKWNQAKARLLTNTEVAGGLSAVDGCVVFNRRLCVLGFGGFIGVSDVVAQNSKQTFKLERDGDLLSYRDFVSAVGGARHQSAARLCAKYREVITIVVSQDRQLHVFCSDPDHHIRRYGPLDPSSLPLHSAKAQ